MAQPDIDLNQHPLPAAERDRVLAAPVFGECFTDHMVGMEFRDGEWGRMSLSPFGPLQLSPATLALHYGQSIFEALKAYRQHDGSAALFRPDRNAVRFDDSARRIAMPTLPSGAFELACALLAGADDCWIPEAAGAALYLRPFMFGSEPHLSVRPSNEYQFLVIASPVASYFGSGLRAISVAVERDEVRATTGGTGAVKFAGNYAAGFGGHRRAHDAGHDQVLWLDAAEHRWVEELNAMNVVFVWRRDGRTVLSTPPLTGTILDGVTRDSLLRLAPDLDHVGEAGDLGSIEVLEEPTSIDAIRSGVRDGSLLEMFACGTAAVVVPIGVLVDRGERLQVADGDAGTVTTALRNKLLGIQHGAEVDDHGWMVAVRRALQDHDVDPSKLDRVTSR